MRRRTTTILLLAVLPLGLLAAPTAAEPGVDPQVPTGRYLIQADDVYYLGSKPGKKEARIYLSNEEMDDNLTYDRDLKHVFFAGDGSPGVTAELQEGRGNAFVHAYRTAGTFEPYVELTDEDGNTATIRPRQLVGGTSVPTTVRVLRDDVVPSVSIRRPPMNQRTKVSSWKVVLLDAADVGAGVEDLRPLVLQRRKGRWFVYDFGRDRWVRGSTTYAATVAKAQRYRSYAWKPLFGDWRLPPVKGLTTGRLVIQVDAYDRAGNRTSATPVDQALTRR